MSSSRRADDTSRTRKGLEHYNDSINPKSPVKHSGKGVFSDIRREPSEVRHERHGPKTKKKGTAKGVDDEDVCITKQTLSEITRTNNSVVLDDAKERKGGEIHGVLRVPESVRTVSSSKKGPAIVQGENYTKKTENDSTLVHEILTCETDLNNLVSRWSGDAAKFQRLTTMCVRLEQLWRTVMGDGEEHVDCNRIWQNTHYIIIESARRHLTGKSSKVGDLKDEFVKFLESTIKFYVSLVEQLQVNEESSADGHSKRKEKMCLLICHHFNIYTGDLYRYREQLVAKPNWAKPRSYYLKAQQLAPKNGKPYNQLAVIAIHAHRRLDAVYYYIRSLTASNPFLSAKESLAALFDETSRKAEKEEEREKAEAEQKKRRSERRQRKVSESEKSKEVWVLPWQVDKMEDVRSSASSTSDVYSPSPSTEVFVPEQLNPEIIKSLVASVLIVHGKLYTKIGLEWINDSVDKCLGIWRSVLRHRLSVNDTSRFMKMLVLCLFSLHNVADREQGSTPARLYYCGLAGAFMTQFLREVFVKCNSLLSSFSQVEINPVGEITSPLSSHDEKKVEGDDQSGASVDKVEELFDQLACYLPLVKIWYDWISCQWELWSVCHREISNEIMRKFWKANEELLNYLIDVGQRFHRSSSDVVVTAASVTLWEDKSLAGFMPLKAILVQPTITTDNGSQKDPITEGLYRIKIILQTSKQLFGALNHNNSSDDNRRTPPLLFDGKTFLLQQQPDVCAANTTATSHTDKSDAAKTSGEMDSDSDSVIVDEDDEAQGELVTEGTGATEQHLLSDIERLKLEKEQLTRKLQNQQQTKQDIEQVLETRAKQEVCQQKIIIPKYIVPDTNCFIFDLISIQRLVGSGHFTVVVPLTVLMELEGLMKGSTSRTDAPTEGARKAVDYLKQCFEVKERCVKLLTTKGNFLSTMSIRSEMTGIQISNDDYILLSSVNLHCKVDSSHKTSGERYTVALLTDDRNLRVKAYAQEFPVKGLAEFMEWCKL